MIGDERSDEEVLPKKPRHRNIEVTWENQNIHFPKMNSYSGMVSYICKRDGGGV